jgi:hypothetical protein
MSVCGVEK